MQLIISSLGVLLIILVIGQTIAFEEEEYEPARKLCLERNNMTEDEYTVLEQAKDFDHVDKKFKCFAHCLSKELGYLNNVGKYNVQKLEKDTKIHKNAIAKIMECVAKCDKEDDPCEYIFQISKCTIGVLQKRG